MNAPISPADQFGLLVGGIEEASKNARSILFALVATASYVLLALLPGARAGGVVSLPVIDANVPDAYFFVVAPVLILVLFTYLHIYLHQLQTRLIRFYQICDGKSWTVEPTLLLYPWLFVFGRSGRGDNLLQKAVALLVVWWVAPLVELVIWANFVGQESIVSLVPLACVGLSLLAGSHSRAKSMSRRGLSLVAGVQTALTVVTVSSVSTLRNRLGLSGLWDKFRVVLESADAANVSSVIALGLVGFSASLLLKRLTRPSAVPLERFTPPTPEQELASLGLSPPRPVSPPKGRRRGQD
ncbi:hypothetical protein [Rubrivirga litoralis]|uniref:Uncharacterized protein n=1 Tax=Rubrivirga litoralis TaxID=3075598 RepID=A0ABU3BUG7_9BACT|nr:hypothetical protein [Rubrivirga sp. F394]MDT0632934.1 hypothetical protein [Rubrivirga sp. F394]